MTLMTHSATFSRADSPAISATAEGPSPDIWAFLFAAIAVEAGAAVMEVYERGCDAGAKSDGSPVTEADVAAEAIILQRLRELAPQIPVIAEEEAAMGRVPETGASFILVDPLDGTREFIARNGEFTVNIALVRDGKPIAGAVYAPVLERLWIGGTTAAVMTIAPGQPLAAARGYRALKVRPAPMQLVAVASRSHCDAQTEAILAKLPIGERISAGSSLKFCNIAEANADVYPRCGPTMEWDTAAGHAVLSAAGGHVQMPDGSPFLYGKRNEGYRNGAFIALGDEAIGHMVRA